MAENTDGRRHAGGITGRLLTAGIVGAMLLMPAWAWAQVAGWQIGVGAGMVPDYEGSNDYEPWPMGTARVDWQSGRFIQLAGTHGAGQAARASANLLSGGHWRFGPVLQYRRKRGDVSNALVHRMPTVHGATEAGAFFGYGFDQFLLEAVAAGAIAGESTGITVEMHAKYRNEVSKNLSYIVALNSSWASDDYMQTYFGVNANQAAQSGLSSYKAKAGFKDVGGSLSVAWRGDEWQHWSIVTMAKYARLIGDADDSSPITDAGSPNQFFGGLMFVYTH